MKKKKRPFLYELLFSNDEAKMRIGIKEIEDWVKKDYQKYNNK